MELFTTIFRLNIFLVLLLFLGIQESYAQQIPAINTSLHNPAYINPAAAGHGQTHVAFIHRRQWMGFDSGVAPQTSVLNGDFSGLLPFADWMGVAVSLKADKAHIFNRINGNLFLSFHLYNTENHRLSLGATAGVLNQRIDFGEICLSCGDDVALYSDQHNKMAFDGGPGVYYEYLSGGNEFAFSFVLPQLFTSNLNYVDEIGHTFDNQFHFIAGARYKANLSTFSLEPAVLFRSVNGEGNLFEKNTLDLSLRAFFLEDLFWVWGGTRINGSTVLGGLGVEIAEQISLQANVESHNKLGLSFEAGVIYNFKERERPPKPEKIKTKKTRPPKPVKPKTDKPDSGKKDKVKQDKLEPVQTDIDAQKLLDDMNIQRASINEVKPGLSKGRVQGVREQLQYAQNALDQANYAGLTSREVNLKLKDVTAYTEQAKIKLERMITVSETAAEAIWASDRLMKEAKQQKNKNKSAIRIYNAIKKDGTAFTNDLNQVKAEYDQFNEKVRAFKLKQNIEASYSKLYLRGDIPGFTDKLNRDLAKVPGIDNNTKVEASRTNKLKIEYSFPYRNYRYTLNEAVDAQTVVLDHVLNQIQILEKEGLLVNSVNLKMMFQDPVSEQTARQTKYLYMGEFGDLFPMTLTFFDNEEKSGYNKTIELEKWKIISEVNFACLKIHGVRDYLNEKGIRKTIPVYPQLTSPNYEQKYAQTFAVEIIFQR